MEASFMEYLKARREDLEQVYQLVQDTIQTIYPQYYPHEIVGFFRNLHSKENIAADIDSGHVRVLVSDNCLIGTGTFSGNHISRLFVLPDFQKNGYGSQIMQCLEKEISIKHNLAILDASLCATCFYEHKGYKTISHNEISTDNGFPLVYGIMEKPLTVSSTRICYEGKFFVPVTNTENGEVDNQTLFAYHQSGNILWAEYYGGEIKKGTMIGLVGLNGELDFYYQHINQNNDIRIGKCHSVPRVLDNGKIELSEQWQWLNGDKSKGISTVREK